MTASERYEGYDEGFAEAEAIYEDALFEARATVKALEHIAVAIVEYFGDLATTMREVRSLTPADVDELKRITRDSPVLTIDGFNRWYARGERERQR